MILVPVPVEHRVDAIRGDLRDMALDRLDEVVEMLVQARVRKRVLMYLGDAEARQRGPRFCRAIEIGRGPLAASRKNECVKLRSGCGKLGQGRPAAKLQVVGMGAEREYRFNPSHGASFNSAALNGRLAFPPNWRDFPNE